MKATLCKSYAVQVNAISYVKLKLFLVTGGISEQTIVICMYDRNLKG